MFWTTELIYIEYIYNICFKQYILVFGTIHCYTCRHSLPQMERISKYFWKKIHSIYGTTFESTQKANRYQSVKANRNAFWCLLFSQLFSRKKKFITHLNSILLFCCSFINLCKSHLCMDEDGNLYQFYTGRDIVRGKFKITCLKTTVRWD